jgi:signal transduction histidine kinase
MNLQRLIRASVLAASALALVLYFVGARLALNSVDAPWPTLFVDPFGAFSAVEMPGRSSRPVPLRYPDQLVAVDDVVIVQRVRFGDMPIDQLRRVVERHARRGDREITLVFRRGGRRLEVRTAITRLSPTTAVIYFVLYHTAGLFVLWFGVVALLVSGHRRSSVPFAFLSLGCALFLGTFYDHHTTARIFPFFMLSTWWTTAGFIWCSYAFPDVPRWHSRGRALAVAALVAVFVALGAASALSVALGADITRLWQWGGLSTAVGSVTLITSVVIRFRQRRPEHREMLRPVLIGIMAGPLCAGLGVALSLMTGWPFVHYLLPLFMPLLPLSLGWGLIRQNILGASGLLTRGLLLVPTLAVSALLTALSWLALRRALPDPSMDIALPTFLSGGFFVALVVLGHRVLGRWLFPATAHFRPTVQQIADRLATLEHHDSLPHALESAIRHWLPTDSVRLLSREGLSVVAMLPQDADARLRRGSAVWTEEDPWRRHLLVPMRSLGELRGVLVLAPKHQGALYTTEDLALLETIASLGAVALHNADSLGQLETLRRMEVDVVRDDKRATLGLLGAELAHEISHPLQLFRGMLRRAGRGPLSETDIEVGGEEIERLERLLSNMRRLEAPAPRQESVRLREPIERAQKLLADLAAEREVAVACEVTASVTVLGDADALVQIFSNLLRNAVQAAPRGGHAGIRVRPSPQVVIDVWDDGPGVPEHLVPTLFHRWVTNKEGGTGLGLAVARNLVVNLRWEINYLREDDRTVFRLHARTDDRSTPPPRMLSPQPDPVDPS